MLEVIRSKNQSIGANQFSQQACEVSQFMKNFFDAVREGNQEEVSTYYADDMEELNFPLRAIISDELFLVDDHLATFGGTLYTAVGARLQLTCVLDKSEGYGQIIHGEIQNDSLCQ